MEPEEVQEFIASASSANFCIPERDSNVKIPKTCGVADVTPGGVVISNELGIVAKIEPNQSDKNKETVECIVEQFLELKRENDKLCKDLIGEKHRTQKYQKKLKYIQDNHVIFERLKQAYMNMKFTEASTRKCIEMTEQSVQCEGDKMLKSIPSDQVNFERYMMVVTNRNAPDQEIYVEPDFLAIRKSVLDGLRDTVAEFKQMIITQPLKTFVLNEQREAKYRRDIASLYQENQNLKQLAIDKQIELDDLKKSLEPRNSVFRKIIAKMAFKMKCMNLLYTEAPNCDALFQLNDKELKVIEQIYKKFESKLKQNKVLEPDSSTEESARENITEKINATPFFTPRSPTSNLNSDQIYYTPRAFENEC